MLTLPNLAKPNYKPSLKLKALAEQERRRRNTVDMTQYRADPVGYAENVLHVEWWDKQKEIARALLTPPYRVLVKASHNVGKTFLGGGLVNWWYDIYDPSLVLTTAPTDTQVKDLLWKEVRVQRGDRGGFRGPQMPRLESSKNHWAHGFTAKDSDAFQGRHEKHLLIIFDEAVGVDSQFWTAAESMFGGEGHAWLCIFNPTDTSSQAYMEGLTDKWHIISMSMLEHPNILAESRGEPPPYPAAIRYARADQYVREWCTQIFPSDRKITDIEWPFGSGQWHRPGPIAESRMLGRWPSQATYNVWSDAAWQQAEIIELDEGDYPVEIGCDVARFGDDFTEMHVRRGPVSLHHEAHNGWDTAQTAGRLKELAGEWGQYAKMTPTQVKVKVDDDGVGGGVMDQRGEHLFMAVSAANTAYEYEKYPNRRSELWFNVAERANDRQLSLSRLPLTIRTELRRQAMAPTWKLDSAGRRVVEKKDETKKRIKRSPDGMDALNLAYAPAMSSMVDFA
jgi:hypothetical protein